MPPPLPPPALLPSSSSRLSPYEFQDELDMKKAKRPLPHPTSRISAPLIISAICFLFGVSGILVATFALLRPPPPSLFLCGRIEDTLKTFHRLSNSRSRSSDGILNGDGGGVLVERPPKLLGFVGIQTGFSSADRRAALRSTWFPSDPEGILRLEQATGLAFRFVIGRTKDVNKMKALHKEVEKYKDFMLINIEEDYLKLPYKTLAFFKAAFELFEAEFYVKADDDIYLRPDQLATLLAKERTHPRTYIGCMKKGPVITDPKLKWFEKSGHLIGNEYFLHAYGPIYALSAEVVASLAIAKNDSLRTFSNEDVTVGSWMLAMNVNYEDNRAICDPRCTPTSIAVWDIPKCSGLCNPAQRLRELHKIDMCSKSPTLPPEDRMEFQHWSRQTLPDLEDETSRSCLKPPIILSASFSCCSPFTAI